MPTFQNCCKGDVHSYRLSRLRVQHSKVELPLSTRNGVLMMSAIGPRNNSRLTLTREDMLIYFTSTTVLGVHELWEAITCGCSTFGGLITLFAKAIFYFRNNRLTIHT